jgi:xanthine dehydrogenase small subunit
MALAAGCHARHHGEDPDWRTELSGNLCRCTGYVSIFEAAERAETAPDWLATRFTDTAWMQEGVRLRSESLDIRDEREGAGMRVSSPATLAEALDLRGEPEPRVVAGATDLGVLWNKGKLRPRHWLDLARISALDGLDVEESATGVTLVAGPLTTWTDFLGVSGERCPEFVPILEAFGGPQIRHVGTLGGNIVNGSPIADSLPLLFAMEATLDLASAAGTRRVPIDRFFKGYKQLDLAADELLVTVRMPLPAPADLLRLVKVSRRRDLDISTFTAAILVRRAGERIAAARIAYGGVGPTVVRMRAAEEALVGRPFTEETFRAAGDVAAGEIRPLTDVRGSADYRRQLARNVLLKFFRERMVAAG